MGIKKKLQQSLHILKELTDLAENEGAQIMKSLKNQNNRWRMELLVDKQLSTIKTKLKRIEAFHKVCCKNQKYFAKKPKHQFNLYCKDIGPSIQDLTSRYMSIKTEMYYFYQDFTDRETNILSENSAVILPEQLNEMIRDLERDVIFVDQATEQNIKLLELEMDKVNNELEKSVDKILNLMK